MKRLSVLLVLNCLYLTTHIPLSLAALKGDINQDNALSIEDVILGLRVIASVDSNTPAFVTELDVNGDNKIGFPEVLNDLKMISEYGEFGIVTSTTGKVWMDRNLGASKVASSVDDEEAYGDLYQWGRGTDGHEKRDSATTLTVSSSDIPGHGDFILTLVAPDYNLHWRIPMNNDLWQGASEANNPCPLGFRLPTYIELETERQSWESTGLNAYTSPLRLTKGGLRFFEGSLIGVGSSGGYWSSTSYSDDIICPMGDVLNCHNTYLGLTFTDLEANDAAISYSPSGTAQSIRCIQD